MPNAFLTFFYTGLSPKAPGTAGSLLAVILGVGIIRFISMETLVLLSILFTLMAIKQINAYEATSGNHDDGRIVIDEVVGVWIALILSSGTLFQIVLSFVFSVCLTFGNLHSLARSTERLKAVGALWAMIC